MLDKQASDLKHHANNQPNPNATFRVINNTNNITNNNTTTNYNSNSDDFLLNGIVGSGDDFENLTINTPRTDVNNDEDDEDEQRLDDGEGEGEYGGGGYGDTEDSNRSPQHLTDRDRHYPYTSDTHLNKLKNVNSNNSLNNHSSNNSRNNNYNHNRNQAAQSKQSVVHHNKSSSLGRGSETSNKSPTNTTTNTDSSKSPTTHTNTETPTGHHQQQNQPQQQQPTKYKNNILNYYFNDKSVNHNELSPRYPQEAQSTYRVPIQNTTNNNHPYNATTTTNHTNPVVASQPPRQIAAPVAAPPNTNPNPRHQIMSDINNHHQQQPQQQHSTTNNHQQHYSEPSYNSTNQYKHLDPTNPDNNHISSLLASGDLELDEPQPDFYLGEPESNSNAQRQRSHFNMIQSPTAANYMNRKPPNNLPPLSNIGLVDLATNQFSSASLLSSQQQQQTQLQAQRSNPSLMTNPNIMTTNPASFSAHPSFNNSTNPMMMMNPASNSLPLGYRSSQMPINLPLGRSEPFDALQTRRRLLNEMSQTNLRMPSSNNGVNAIRPSAQYPLNSVIETRMAPLGSNNLVGAALNETLVSNDVDDLIDVMAKRRIAIKKLENEMYRQHSRASSMIRPSYDDQLMKTASQMNLRYVDPYSLNDRSSRAGQMMMQQGPPPPPGLLSYENPLVAGRTPSMINSMGDLTSRPNALNLISNLDYPSESNREIYSTYLVDSIRPHYSAKRLLNGIRPGPPGSSVPRQQHTSSLYNNQQPVNSYGGGGLGDDLGSPSRQYRAQPFNDYNNNSLYTNSSSSMMMRNNNNNNNNYANQNSVENDQFADDYLYE